MMIVPMEAVMHTEARQYTWPCVGSNIEFGAYSTWEQVHLQHSLGDFIAFMACSKISGKLRHPRGAQQRAATP